MSEQLLEILEQTRERSGAPALAAIVVDHETVVAQAVVGVRRLGEETPVTVDDRFHLGSCGKAMTATTCALAVNEGLLAWHTSPLQVFSDLEDNIHPEYRAITLEMLLRHTAGIPPYTEDAHLADLPRLEGTPTEQRVTLSRWLLAERGPVVTPGTEFSYSNAGYSIAAAMLEVVTGKAWELILQETLLQPLAMEAGIGWPARQDSHQPWGHWVQDGQLVPHPPDDLYALDPFMAPAGDIHVSLLHQGNFLQMNLRGLLGGETTLPAELLQHLHNHGQSGTGLGWVVQPREEIGIVSEHMGGAGTFVFVEGISHEQDRAVAIAANAGDEPNAAIEKAVAAGYKEMLARYARPT